MLKTYYYCALCGTELDNDLEKDTGVCENCIDDDD